MPQPEHGCLGFLGQKVRELERRYEFVDPANRLVAAELEAKLEAAKRALKAAEARPHRLDADNIFSEETFAELVQLSGDVQRLLDAPTTEARDKKELFRTLMKHVVVEDQDRERIRAHIVWADDGVQTPLDVRLNGYANRLIQELHAQGVDPTDIAKRLNDEDVLTLRSNRWTRQAVLMVLWRLRKQGRK